PVSQYSVMLSTMLSRPVRCRFRRRRAGHKTTLATPRDASSRPQSEKRDGVDVARSLRATLVQRDVRPSVRSGHRTERPALELDGHEQLEQIRDPSRISTGSLLDSPQTVM